MLSQIDLNWPTWSTANENKEQCVMQLSYDHISDLEKYLNPGNDKWCLWIFS